MSSRRSQDVHVVPPPSPRRSQLSPRDSASSPPGSPRVSRKSYSKSSMRSSNGGEDKDLPQRFLSMRTQNTIGRSSTISKQLIRVDLFKDCTGCFLEALSCHLEETLFSAGEVIFHQGDSGTNMYLLTIGQVEVVIDGVGVVAVLDHGSIFGEMAVLTSDPKVAKRAATLRAKTSCLCWAISRAVLHQVLKAYPKDEYLLQSESERRMAELRKKGFVKGPDLSERSWKMDDLTPRGSVMAMAEAEEESMQHTGTDQRKSLRKQGTRKSLAAGQSEASNTRLSAGGAINTRSSAGGAINTRLSANGAINTRLSAGNSTGGPRLSVGGAEGTRPVRGSVATNDFLRGYIRSLPLQLESAASEARSLASPAASAAASARGSLAFVASPAASARGSLASPAASAAKPSTRLSSNALATALRQATTPEFKDWGRQSVLEGLSQDLAAENAQRAASKRKGSKRRTKSKERCDEQPSVSAFSAGERDTVTFSDLPSMMDLGDIDLGDRDDEDDYGDAQLQSEIHLSSNIALREAMTAVILPNHRINDKGKVIPLKGMARPSYARNARRKVWSVMESPSVAQARYGAIDFLQKRGQPLV